MSKAKVEEVEEAEVEQQEIIEEGEGEEGEAPPPAERLYLRSEADGHLFAYTDELANRPDLTVVTESEAYPERHIPDYVQDAAGDAPEVDLAGGITDETGAEVDPPTDPALAKQAAKGWPKGK